MNNLFDKKNSNLGAWKKLLRWEHLPDFGNCHEYIALGQVDEFVRRYYIPEDLKVFSANLALKLEEIGVQQSNWVLLKGDPGVGKTTFIYALIAHANLNEALRSKFVFHAFHANNAHLEGWKIEVLKCLKSAFKELYRANNAIEAFDKLCCVEEESEQGLALQVQKLKNYIFNHGSERDHVFERKLVFIIDNVDTVTDEDRVIEFFDFINTTIEPSGIKKWIAIRDETIDSYSAENQKRIQKFVPDINVMPSISLYGLISQRIDKLTGGDERRVNPFSKELCDNIVLPYCDGNLRSALNMLQKILESTEPKGFSDREYTDDKVIQNYLRTQVLSAMSSTGRFINLHDLNFRVKELEFPFVWDMFNLTLYTSSERALLAMLYEATDLRNRFSGYVVVERDARYSITATEFQKGLKLLHDFELIVWRKGEQISLTKKGKSLLDAATPGFYSQYCRSLDTTGQRSKYYWETSLVDISHGNIGSKYGKSTSY